MYSLAPIIKGWPPLPIFHTSYSELKIYNLPATAVFVKSAAFYQGNDLRKPSGGVKGRVAKVKRKALCGGPPRVPSVGPQEVEVEKVTGGNLKLRLRSAQYANVYNPKEKKIVKAKIISVISTPSNPDFAKRGRIVKGAVIQTEIGRAVVTSRPGQDGVVNAVLIE